MKTNVGLVDRIVRIIVAVILVVVAVVLGFATWWWLLIPAALLVFTATIGFCGIYALFNISTCPRQAAK